MFKGIVLIEWRREREREKANERKEKKASGNILVQVQSIDPSMI